MIDFFRSILLALLIASCTLIVTKAQAEDVNIDKCNDLLEQIEELENKLSGLELLSRRGLYLGFISLGTPYYIYRAFRYGPDRALGHGEGPSVLGYPLHPLNWPFYPVTIPMGIVGGAASWLVGSSYEAIRSPILEKELNEKKLEWEALTCG